MRLDDSSSGAGTATPTAPDYSALADLAAVRPSAGLPRQTVRAPFTGAPIGSVPLLRPADVESAATTARAAQPDWAATSPIARRRIALRFAGLVLDEAERLLDLVQWETGKSRLSAFEELLDVATVAAYYGRNAARLLRPRRRRGAIPVLVKTVEHHRPVGLVGVIPAWNYPLTLPATDALPALLAGNAVLLKPASLTPFSALAIADLLYRAGLPRELLQVVTGPGSSLGNALIDAVDYVVFTGSTETGRRVAARAAARLIGCSAELGGKNPMLVLADADVEQAAANAVTGCFSNSGQLCISIERLYVHEAVHDEFVARFVANVEAMRLAPGLDWEVDMGSLISADQVATITGHVEDAVNLGATVLAGGRTRPDLGPLFYEPTVLTGVTPQMKVARAETFGPLVSIYRVASDEEAIAAANDTPYGLHASVWSRRHGPQVAARIRTGTVAVNEAYTPAWGSHDAPMGGMGNSGLGRRHGTEGLLKYTEPQTVAEQRLARLAPPDGVANQTYARVLAAAVRVLNAVR